MVPLSQHMKQENSITKNWKTCIPNNLHGESFFLAWKQLLKYSRNLSHFRKPKGWWIL